MIKLGFIGAGPVGTTFGVRLAEQGYPVAGVADISPAATERFAGLVPGSRVYGHNPPRDDTAYSRPLRLMSR